jgi:alpha-glucosidase
MRVRFRLFDDAVAFRYELPQQENLKTANIVEELTQFRVLGQAAPGGRPPMKATGKNISTTIRRHRVGTAQTPFTIRRDDGVHVSIHEAALVDYSGMNIAHVQGGMLRADLTPSSSGTQGGARHAVRDTLARHPDRAGRALALSRQYRLPEPQ